MITGTPALIHESCFAINPNLPILESVVNSMRTYEPMIRTYGGKHNVFTAMKGSI